ncbi:hypothetical protein PPROV_000439500 [Pycnococcus provasolii]|uniref:histone deacetylase n=3 Tax=Pycnococcus provasolii TaxID=41880 RepID=A0A830HF93_9CHLO|nr:hypothetical protein PPROV_000439500 [Pycnococcus provasolii]
MKRFASRSISDRFDQLLGGDDESSEDSPNGKRSSAPNDNDNDNDERNPTATIVDASAAVEDDMNLLARQLTRGLSLMENQLDDFNLATPLAPGLVPVPTTTTTTNANTREPKPQGLTLDTLREASEGTATTTTTTTTTASGDSADQPSPTKSTATTMNVTLEPAQQQTQEIERHLSDTLTISSTPAPPAADSTATTPAPPPQTTPHVDAATVAAAPKRQSARQRAGRSDRSSASSDDAKTASATTAPISWSEDGLDTGNFPSSRVGLVWDEAMLLHAPALESRQLELPGRVSQIRRTVLSEGLAQRCRRLDSRPATEQEVLRCHSDVHMRNVALGTAIPDLAWDSEQHDVLEKGDLYYNAHTSSAAILAAGSASEAALAVSRGEVDAALAVVRPPGHHATCSQAMGFCYYNSAAIAARAAVADGGMRRVVVLDWDVHHGNGTQDILYDDPNIMYISLHRYGTAGNYFYPGTGDATEVGAEGAEGRNLNVPWTEKGVGNGDYLAAFDWVILPIIREFAPQLIIVAAGFDAAQGDPLGGCRVTPTGYAQMTKRLIEVSEGGRICVVLEGGYSQIVTAECVASVLKTLLAMKGGAPQASNSLSVPEFRSTPTVKISTESILRGVVESQKPHWDLLRGESFEASFEAHVASAVVERVQTRSNSNSAGGAGAGFPNAPPLRGRKGGGKKARPQQAPAQQEEDL